jgi:hypothetical protein
MKKPPGNREPAAKVKKAKADRTQKANVPKLFPAVPFHLPGHSWIPTNWLGNFPAENVIRTFGDLALVRRPGKRQRMFTKPKEGEEAACAWSQERSQQEIQKFLTIDQDIEASLFARAKRKKSGARPMALKAQDLIAELFVAAREGNEEAASSVASVLQEGVIQLTDLAKANPKVLQPAARMSWKWPVMKSRHPLISDEHETMFGALNLGYDLPFYFDRWSKWRADEFTEIALGLLNYVWHSRKENCGLYDYQRIGELADGLPEFRRGPDANKWWELAEAHLLFTYPKPETIREFTDLVRLKRRTPSRVRDRILERIKQHFLNFARP